MKEARRAERTLVVPVARATAAGGSTSAAAPRRRRRPGPPAGCGWSDRPHGRLGPAHIDGAVGSAGLRQNDDRAPPRKSHGLGVRAAFRSVLGRSRFAARSSSRPRAAGGRSRHAAVHRRDPPLQSRPAGRFSALCRGRHGHSGRRYHRKSVIRAEPAAALALPRAGAEPAR